MPNYIIKIMASGEVIEYDDNCRMTYNGIGDVRVGFGYKKSFDWHFHYCHAMDNHNNLRHVFPSLEDTWMTRGGRLGLLHSS